MVEKRKWKEALEMWKKGKGKCGNGKGGFARLQKWRQNIDKGKMAKVQLEEEIVSKKYTGTK